MGIPRKLLSILSLTSSITLTLPSRSMRVGSRLLLANPMFPNISLDCFGRRTSTERGGFSMNFLHVNILAVLVAAVVQWLLGYLWYGVIFKKDYQALVQTDSAKTPNAGGVMALIFICNLILC